MAKAYYFNYISVSDTSKYPTDEAIYICEKMVQIVIATFKEYGLHIKDNNYLTYRQGEKLLSDEKSFCCVYPDKCDAAWDPSTWGYSKDNLGEIFVIFKKDNKIVVSFGTNRIAKKITNREIMSRIRDKAVASGIISEESEIYETKERTPEKQKSDDIEKQKGNDIEKQNDNDIKKHIERRYARGGFYGYGFIREYDYSPVKSEYAQNVTITTRHNSDYITFDMGMRPITLKRTDLSGNFQDVEQPIYLVEDDGVWKEYFSGTEIKHMKPYGTNGHGSCTYYVGDGFKGIRELVFGNLSLMEARGFANAISRYSDDEIKSMVRQFLELKEKAATWGPKFDKVVEEFEKDQNSKNEMAANKLADGMGKYANIQPGFHNEIISDRNTVHSAGNGANKGKKSRNGLIVVLVIALIVVCFLWITK